jgi:hypothetical protein
MSAEIYTQYKNYNFNLHAVYLILMHNSNMTDYL